MNPLNTESLERLKATLTDLGNQMLNTIYSLNIEDIPKKITDLAVNNPVSRGINNMNNTKPEKVDPNVNNEYGRTRVGVVPGFHLTEIMGHKPHTIKDGGNV